MRFIFIEDGAEPPARWVTLAARRAAALALKATPSERAAYLKRNPSWGKLKRWLSELSDRKCWYCEGASRRAPFDVDHFRPKLATTVDRARLQDHEGYYWLAYSWTNFRLSCQDCNRPEKDESGVLRGKSNEFPLKDEAPRCFVSSQDTNSEEPRFLDPCCESDVGLLAHPLDGEVKPVFPEGTWEYQRARYTIDTLRFNSPEVPQEKRRCWQILAIVIRSAGDNPDEDTKNLLQHHASRAREYSSFFRAAIGTHRDKAWIEEILETSSERAA